MEIVPFEIAKKLKEKGFKEKCLAYYDIDDNVGLLFNMQYYSDYTCPCQYTDLLQSHNTDLTVTQPDDSENCCDAPTISQVLKWLREEKKIDISPCCYRGFQGEFMGWYYLIVDMRVDVWQYIDEETCKDNSKSTYESAALAGISYVIDNLI